jgi:predicted DNA-binding antitoxin AbrB/MazE fold protein
MNTVFGTYENGSVKLDAPVDWSEGSRVVVQPTEAEDEQIGMREEDWPADPKGIAEWRARFAALEPLEFTAEDEAEIAAARKAVRAVTLDAVRRKMGLA